MKRAIPAILIVAALLVAARSAHSFGIGGEGRLFGRAGSVVQKITPPAPSSCASPDAPDGAIDLSKCSNSYYLAVILF